MKPDKKGTNASDRDAIEWVLYLARLTRRVPNDTNSPRTQSERSLMRVLNHHDGESVTELAGRLDMRPSSLSELLDRLEASGIVQRHRDENDARVIRIRLSEQGKKEALQNSKTAYRMRTRLADCLSDEENIQFCEMCSRISMNIRSKIPDESRKAKDE